MQHTYYKCNYRKSIDSKLAQADVETARENEFASGMNANQHHIRLRLNVDQWRSGQAAVKQAHITTETGL
ncbi:hypothetical protein SNOG_00260 [Parastagonospora nodorum SN15]|uniref:Uncharacterized protein n=1 Tax=Phaeosphaeria nodorum (strain SN15 / ATCC MYA-4574 / FGSC 10173) TaxID=321614 RepID=Q0V6V4_PHANO|nr:hypothetical protein SNOG_00260 [Parastagonospora nodorum SN15]EAT91755.1 hypothetical protein SNOG_00260 [Parastagonospora nodorum SN15]